MQGPIACRSNQIDGSFALWLGTSVGDNEDRGKGHSTVDKVSMLGCSGGTKGDREQIDYYGGS